MPTTNSAINPKAPLSVDEVKAASKRLKQNLANDGIKLVGIGLSSLGQGQFQIELRVIAKEQSEEFGLTAEQLGTVRAIRDFEGIPVRAFRFTEMPKMGA